MSAQVTRFLAAHCSDAGVHNEYAALVAERDRLLLIAQAAQRWVDSSDAELVPEGEGAAYAALVALLAGEAG